VAKTGLLLASCASAPSFDVKYRQCWLHEPCKTAAAIDWCVTVTVTIAEAAAHLIEQEVGVDLVLHQVCCARWARGLVFEVCADALEAERVTTRRDKRIFNCLNAYGTGQVLWAQKGASSSTTTR
jgi:hypothetical protein